MTPFFIFLQTASVCKGFEEGRFFVRVLVLERGREKTKNLASGMELSILKKPGELQGVPTAKLTVLPALIFYPARQRE